ncbi:MAG: hypothetical protein KKE86_17460 [Planctomycetes bacterium]|nr:hypothetical protein [Planctomycetota bacterium]
MTEHFDCNTSLKTLILGLKLQKYLQKTCNFIVATKATRFFRAPWWLFLLGAVKTNSAWPGKGDHAWLSGEVTLFS